MKTQTSMLAASLLGALAMLPCRVASAQGAEVRVDGIGAERTTAPALFLSSLEPGWWQAITERLDAMRGLRGRRIPPSAARQVDLPIVSATPPKAAALWQASLPPTQASPHLLALRFGPVDGMPVGIAPVTVSTTDGRGESGELLGARVTLPWLVP